MRTDLSSTTLRRPTFPPTRQPTPWRGHFAACCLLLVLGISCFAPTLPADQPKETVAIRRIQAGFLYNFLRFASWPEGSIPKEQPFIVGVVGDSPAGEIIKRELASKAHAGHPIIVRQLATDESVEGVHLLFISRKVAPETTNLLSKLANKPVLTIGETDEFTHQGGMIRLFIKDDTIHFTINLRAARDSGIVLSSQLAAMADPDTL